MAAAAAALLILNQNRRRSSGGGGYPGGNGDDDYWIGTIVLALIVLILGVLAYAQLPVMRLIIPGGFCLLGLGLSIYRALVWYLPWRLRHTFMAMATALAGAWFLWELLAHRQ